MGASVSAAGTCNGSKAPPPSIIVFPASATTPKEGEYCADPNYGFEDKKRKERVPTATLAEMASAKVEPKYRDFCVHKLMAFKKCQKDNLPFPSYPCHHAKHELEECQYEEYIIRMKEYERERRLLHRKKRKEAALKKEKC